MDYENQLKKYSNSTYAKSQRSSSVNQPPQKQEGNQQIKPQALLKKLEEILQQRQQHFNLEKLKKKKTNQSKGNNTERQSEKKHVQKLLENQKWEPDIQNFMTEQKERKSAYPNLMSLQLSSQNLFDMFQQDNNSRNPTITTKSKRDSSSKKSDNSPQKGRVKSIVEGYNLREKEKETFITLNQQLQIQNNHLNEQLRFEQSQNNQLSLQILNMNDQITFLTNLKKLEKKDKENDDVMRSLKSQLDMIKPEYYRQQEHALNIEQQLTKYQSIEKDMKELEQMLPQISTYTTLFVQQNAQISELQDLITLQNNIIDKILNKKDFPLNNLILVREPRKTRQYNNDLPFESSQCLDNLINQTRIQVNALTERFIHELFI